MYTALLPKTTMNYRNEHSTSTKFTKKWFNKLFFKTAIFWGEYRQIFLHILDITWTQDITGWSVKVLNELNQNLNHSLTWCYHSFGRGLSRNRLSLVDQLAVWSWQRRDPVTPPQSASYHPSTAKTTLSVIMVCSVSVTELMCNPGVIFISKHSWFFHLIERTKSASDQSHQHFLIYKTSFLLQGAASTRR